MDDRLIKIKRLVAAGSYIFTMKADVECAIDGLTREDIIESILTAQFLRVKNSTSPWRYARRERLYIIDSFNFEGVPIYSRASYGGMSEMKRSSTSLSRESGRSVPTEDRFSKCPLCGSRKVELRFQTISLDGSRSGTVRVRLRRWRCSGCGESFLPPESRRKIDAALGLSQRV
jgi:hypothetical protein